MEEILLLTSFCITLYTWKSKHFHKSALHLFNLYWLVIFFLYSFRFLGLYSAREETFRMYFVGITSFFLGYVLLTFLWQSKKTETVPDKYISIKKRVFIILIFASVIIYILKSLLALPLWLAGGMGEVKTSSIMESSLSLGIWDIFFVYVAKPLHATLMIYAVIAIFQGRKDRLLYISTAILLVLGFVGTASRFSIVEILISAFAYVYLFTNLNFRQFAQKYPKLFTTSVSVLVVVFGFMAVSGNVFEGIYCYLCGCIPCSDNALLRLDESIRYNGIVTFNGVFRVFNQIPSMLGLTAGVRDILDLAYEYMIRFEETTEIGPGIRYNAFISMFTYFYADAGYTGVWVLSFLFGGFTAVINKRAFINPTYSSCSLLLFIVIMIFNSIVRAQTFLVPSVMTLFYLYFLVPKERVVIIPHKRQRESVIINREVLNNRGGVILRFPEAVPCLIFG